MGAPMPEPRIPSRGSRGLDLGQELIMRCDVAIVGAGPSGAWTATLLARSGANVLLIDPSHPREKPCGGGITRRALAIVGDAIPADRFPAVCIQSARFVDSRCRHEADVPLPSHPAALLVSSRTEFDGALLSD